jgi:hypothetical protein
MRTALGDLVRRDHAVSDRLRSDMHHHPRVRGCHVVERENQSTDPRRQPAIDRWVLLNLRENSLADPLNTPV